MTQESFSDVDLKPFCNQLKTYIQQCGEIKQEDKLGILIFCIKTSEGEHEINAAANMKPITIIKYINKAYFKDLEMTEMLMISQELNNITLLRLAAELEKTNNNEVGA